MRAQQTDAKRQLVLLGGGHAHAVALLEFIKAKPANTQITLISSNRMTPYSGMLPGLIAGHYRFEEMHIDLAKLCLRGGFRFIEHSAIDLKPNQQHITLDDHSSIFYDVLSINIGITPDSNEIEGANKYGISVKPIAEFYSRLNAFRQHLKQDSEPQSIAVIGGGAGSVEICFALQESLRNEFTTQKIDFQLISGTRDILPDYPLSLRKKIKQRLKEKHISLLCETRIQSVTEDYLTGTNKNQCLTIPCTKSIWCTSAKAATWLENSGLDLYEGFINVDASLRSTSHRNIFACGDIAHFSKSPLPKAGVFAVRQGPILAHNLLNQLDKKPLQIYKPQKHFLSLLICGNKYATGSRGKWLIVSGHWVWKWKDFIDRRFMKLFRQ